MSSANGGECAVCGAPVRAPFRAPQPEIAPDLDMRPGEPTRSTLRDWVQTCGNCGAAGPDLARLPDGAGRVVRSAPYQALLHEGSEETLSFRRWAMICRETGDLREAAEATLQAAWAADDANSMAEAAALRREVAALWTDATDEETCLRRLDVLRRTGDFDAAEAFAARLATRAQEEAGAAVLVFQRARIAARDIGRHLISSAVPPPAHAPHVSHGRRPPPKFWERLFRR